MDRPSNRLGYRFRIESPRPAKAMPRKARTSGRPVAGATSPVDGSAVGAAPAFGAAVAAGAAVAPGAAVAAGATGAGAAVGAAAGAVEALT